MDDMKKYEDLNEEHFLEERGAKYGYMSVEEACQLTIDEVKEIYRANGNL